MNSIGIEWETNALIKPTDELLYLPDFNINYKIPIKFSSWSLSLEPAHIYEESICDNRIEVQLGPIYATDFKIQNRVYDEMCKNFLNDWNKILSSYTISLNKVDFDIFTYSKINDEKKDEIFRDCYFDKLLTEKDKIGFSKNLSNISGIPQITFGINIKYVIQLFKHVHDLYSKCSGGLGNQVDDVSNSYKYIKDFIIISISKIDEYKKLKPIDKFKTFYKKYNNVLVLIMIEYYYLLTMKKQFKYGGVLKYRFLFKPRSNIMFLYNKLTDNEKKIFNDWSIMYMKQNTSDEEFLVKHFWDFHNPMTAYTIEYNGGLKINVSPLNFYTIDTGISENKIKKYETMAKINKVSIHPLNFSNIIEADFDILGKTVHVNPYTVCDFDIGEWIMDGDIFFFELRSVKKMNELLSGCLVENKLHIHSSVLCEKIGNIIFNFLNTIVDVKLF